MTGLTAATVDACGTQISGASTLPRRSPSAAVSTVAEHSKALGVRSTAAARNACVTANESRRRASERAAKPIVCQYMSHNAA